MIQSYAQSSDSIAKQLKDNVKEATSDSVQIRFQIDLAKQLLTSNVDTTRIIFNDVLKIIDKKNGNYYQSCKAESLNYLGILDSKEGSFDNALTKYLKALDITEGIQDSTGIGLTFHNLGMFYRRQKEYRKAKQYLQKAIQIKEKLVDIEDLALSHHMLAVTYYQNKQLDSSRFHIAIVKDLPCSDLRKSKANGSLASLYYSNKEYDKAIEIYKENIGISKKAEDLNELSVSYLNVAVLYNALQQYDNAVPYLDSAITEAKKIKNNGLLRTQYYSKSNLNETRKEYKLALQDYKLYKMYNDSINDIEKTKRITELELNYQFDKEKQAGELRLENETSKKQLYLLLFVIAIIMGCIIFWLTRKNAKQRLALSNKELASEQLEKVKAELALVTKEKELKNAVIENSLRQEVLSKTLGDIKEIIKLENEKERKTALQSLSASLLSEKATTTSTTDLKSYMDTVSMDFKVILDSKFPDLKEKEKELLCLMTLGLNATEISKLQNNTVSAIKSARSRIRKKIGVDSKQDIIEFIKNTGV
ncbi:tetratricopeptide repeat protein [Aquimarina litoralis]|uniref:tetratricopeptide repeat protein n=1 Tax=Aquimarina litoralis TaxID=584605 RepID=UPI001C55B791|nr:tetratricopeptide repeat protein [Aquimarina litoralis]MBW1298163.1 tetratricopeptide repeat protein [Aquimarina litoralis]